MNSLRRGTKYSLAKNGCTEIRIELRIAPFLYFATTVFSCSIRGLASSYSNFTGFGETYVAARTIKQLLTQFLFEALDLMADGRCRNEELFAGRAKALIPRRDAESSQTAQGDFGFFRH